MELSPRQITWTSIQNSGLHRLWAPSMVDIALNIFPGKTVDYILSSDVFYKVCAASVSYTRKGFDDWTPKGLDAWVHGKTPPIYSFVTKVFGGIRKKVNLFLSDHDKEECQGTIISHIIMEADKYKPEGFKDGEIVSWGYEAFLSQWASNKAWRTVTKNLLANHNAISFDQPCSGEHSVLSMVEVAFASDVSVKPSHFGFEFSNLNFSNSLFPVVDSGVEDVLSQEDSRSASAYLLFIAGCSLLQIASTLHTSKTSVERMVNGVAEKILHRIREGIAELMGMDVSEASLEVLGYFGGINSYLNVGIAPSDATCDEIAKIQIDSAFFQPAP